MAHRLPMTSMLRWSPSIVSLLQASARRLLAPAAFVIVASLLLAPGVQAQAQRPLDHDHPLAPLINAYRAAPGACNGQPATPAAALTQHPALSQLRIGAGTFIESALERVGYPVDGAQAIYVTGPDNARAAIDVLQKKYCSVLLNPRFSSVGSYREGATWTVVLARPAAPLPSTVYPDWRDAGRLILAQVNAARASARLCGEQAYPAAPPLQWNDALGNAALTHSRDMATRRYFSHRAKDGSQVAERATRAGYSWRRVGENIAFGQRTPEEAVAGWLDSPGHCANIMHRGFTEMGAAYGVTPARQTGIIYWTQAFGKPR
jgi:uncharacterized protein YkwD